MKLSQCLLFLGFFFLFLELFPVEPCYYYGDKIYCLEVKEGFVAIDKNNLLDLKKVRALKNYSADYVSEGISILNITGISKDELSQIAKQRSILFFPVVSVKNGPLLPLTGEIGVFFKDGVSEDNVSEILKKFSLKVVRTIKDYKGYYIFSSQTADPFLISRKIYETGLVEWAQPVWLEKPLLASVPNDTLYPEQWHHQVVNSEEAWNLAKGYPDAKIAVVDSGVDTKHFDLFLQFGASFVPNDQAVDPNMGGFQNQYIMAHGTAVSGIAAGQGDNGFGISGVCPKCSVIPIKYIGLETTNPPTDRKFNAIKCW